MKIKLEYAENIHRVLEDYNSMGLKMISQEIKDIVSEEAYKKISDIFWKHHNANCGPFNRHIKKLIEDERQKNKEKTKA